MGIQVMSTNSWKVRLTSHLSLMLLTCQSIVRKKKLGADKVFKNSRNCVRQPRIPWLLYPVLRSALLLPRSASALYHDTGGKPQFSRSVHWGYIASTCTMYWGCPDPAHCREILNVLANLLTMYWVAHMPSTFRMFLVRWLQCSD